MDRKVAIVGYAYRFPQSSSNDFWSDLVNERDLITEVDSSRWSFDTYFHPDKKHPGTAYTFQAGSLGDVSQFDAEFFGISPREASLMDPQQRYLLEMSWEAIEHAGIPASQLRGTDSGVFIGISSTEYANRIGDDLGVINANTATGNTSSIASNRISYAFDLHGPSMSVDTACSSAMVAFHQACQAILRGEINTALTGGISLHLHPFGFITFSKATMLSPDGRCKVFDASANGYVRSEGGGIFLLKDYDQAITDGDIIHAVVAGSAVNTDGYKSGMTIPSSQRQTELMKRAYQQAEISPDEIDYIEAHGTGTPVGDPIESRSIGDAIGKNRSTPLPIGSVKSNLGHLEPASGVAGLIKALLIIKHRKIPATISMKTPNPDIRFNDWNIRVVDVLEPITKEGAVTVGINSFGFGGANAHVILSSAEPVTAPSSLPVLDYSLPFIISGKNDVALRANAQKLIEYIQQETEVDLYDICWNYCLRKERLAQSTLLYAKDTDELVSKLTTLVAAEDSSELTDIYTAKGITSGSGPVFVYSGNGCQWETMGKELLESSDIFAEAIHKVDQIFSNYADFSLIDELKGLNGRNRYEQTEIAQPALFALQVGVTEHLKHHGITPAAVTGHSVGEVAAAWACGALSLEDAVRVIFNRSYWQGKTKGHGAMTAVGLSEAEMHEILETSQFNNVYLAGINSSRGITLAGDPDQLTRIEAQLQGQKTFNVRLPLDYAFHSPVMDPIESSLLSSLDGLMPSAGSIPFISTVTGSELSGEQLGAQYWWQNIRQPVLFKQALDHAFDMDSNCFIEIGAHPILKSYQQDQAREKGCDAAIIPTLTKKAGNLNEIDHAVAAAIIAGAADFRNWFPVSGKRLALPVYAWQKESHWHPVSIESHQLLNRIPEHPLLGAPIPLQPMHWESILDCDTHPWLADHQVGESVVFPGAGYIEMALQAATHFKSSDVVEIEELEILAPMILEEGHSKVVQTEVESSTGTISISSRTQTVSEQWNLNCKARAVHQTAGIALQGLIATKPTRTPDFDSQRHQQVTLAAGLQYGSAFSAIKHGWFEENNVIAELDIPAPIADQTGQYLLHPGMLDSAMQTVAQLLVDELESKKGIAFIPIRVERLTLSRHRNAQPTLVKLNLIKRAHHSLLARYEMYDCNGEIIAVMDGVRLRAVRLYKEGSREISYLDYHLTPAPKTGNGLTDLNSVYVSELDRYRPQIERYTGEVAPLLDNLMLHAIAEMFEALETETELSDAAFEELNIHDPDRQPLRHHLLTYALEMGILISDAEGYRVAEDFKDSDISSGLIWNTLVRDYPDYFTAIHLTGSATLNLKQRFLGGSDELPVSDSYQKFYKDLHNQITYPVVSKALIRAVSEKQLKAGQRLEILEISAIKPYYAQSLCSELNFEHADFTYASYSEEAIEQFHHLQERYPLSSDISLDLEQPYAGKQYSFAIVTLDNFDIQKNLKLLEQVKNLLTPGATIYFSGLEPIIWLDAIFGSSPDWWHNETSCQITSEQWQSTLQEHGFTHVDIVSGTDGSHLLSAQWEGQKELTNQSETSPHWLVLSNQKETESALIKSMTDAGIHLDIRDITEESDLIDYLNNQNQAGTPYSHILLLNGLGSDSEPHQNQTDRTSFATSALRALESLQFNATIYILTQGVGVTYGLTCSNRNGTVRTPADSALWGFGRTLMNEALNNPVRMIDLPYKLNDTILTVLTDELKLPAEESELLISTQGERFAPRLRYESTPGIAKPLSETQNQQISLGFDLPGQLKNLQWQARTAPEPASHEVEIEVKATGLNFRDIMYALGLLSDEAIENGFAGATMGLEFSGKVLSVGADVDNYQIGDEVVGFGSACFSNRIVADTAAIAPIPDGVSFEGAATIPSTFLTVYYALKHLARVQPGEKVLIHGAAGGVGIAAIQIAQWLGAEIYATVGSTEKREFLQLMGVPEARIFNSRQLTYAEEILNSTSDGKGVDVVLNSLAGEAVNQNFRVLKPFGRFLELGKRDFYENTHIGLRPFRNNISYFGIDADQLQLEQPELTKKLFSELMELFNDGTLFPLPYTQFDAYQVVDAFRYMQQAKQIGKIVVTYEQGIKADTDISEKQPESALQLNPDATYLVTGGLGGFGLRTAQWLVDKGAQHLLLLSRRGAASEEAAEFIANCAEKGINVVAKACDVTDYRSLEQVIALCGTELPPLKGVIHAATLINDNLVRNLDRSQIENSLAAKMLGALYLDQLTEQSDLEMFVLYSSCTTLMGNPGQAAYVAANHWLEALAATRVSKGLPATCVRWGAIDDVGFLARNEEIKDALQKRLGGNALSSEQALNVLEQMILNNIVNLGVMELDWGAMSRFLPSAEQSKFVEIDRFSGEHEQSDEDQLDLQAMMQEMTPEQFNGAILEILTHELSEILMIPASKIDPEKSIYDMGMDSLMGVELMAALEAKLGIQVPVMALTETPKLSQLTGKIITLIEGDEQDSDTADIKRLAVQHGEADDAEAADKLMQAIAGNKDAQQAEL